MANRKCVLTLAKELEFHTEGEYFGYICDSHINGNLAQCKQLFNNMREKDKLRFIGSLRNDDYTCIGHEYSQKIANFLTL